MAYNARARRFTVYDKMEQDGAFASNSANREATAEDGTGLYRGPVEFPKMLYHPDGEYEVLFAGEEIDTPRGPKTVNRQEALIFMIVSSEAEERMALADGWHDHPAKAIARRAELHPELKIKVPPIGAGSVIDSQEAEIRRLSAELAKLREASAGTLPPSVLGKKKD